MPLQPSVVHLHLVRFSVYVAINRKQRLQMWSGEFSFYPLQTATDFKVQEAKVNFAAEIHFPINSLDGLGIFKMSALSAN